MNRRLYLYEEVLLLSLRDDEGTMAAGMEFAFALGGAFVAEMLLEERIRVDTSGRKPLVEASDRQTMDDPLLDECLEKIRSARRRASVGDWVSRFAHIKRLKHRAAEGLCRRGILKPVEGKVLLIFSRKIYPTVDPGPERELVERLRTAIFTDSSDLDPRTILSVSLADSANLLRIVFDKKELSRRKKRIRKIVEGERMGKAAKDAIDAARAAVLAAVTAATVVTTVTHH